MIICQNLDTCDVSQLKCKQKLTGNSFELILKLFTTRGELYKSYELKYVKLIAQLSVAKGGSLFGFIFV